MAQRALITGITGFAGSHLAELLVGRGAEVYGLARDPARPGQVAHLLDKVKLYPCDLREEDQAKKVLQKVAPDQIYHLAALSPGALGLMEPGELLATNLLGTLHLLEAVVAVVKEGGKPAIHLAGSSAQYGEGWGDGRPLEEGCPLRPITPYGISKAAQSLLGYQYYRSHGLRIVRTIAFNYTGPREPESRACSAFARQIAWIEAGLGSPPLQAGNLSSSRDLTDVRDVVEGYHLALEKGVPGEVYNLCSGRALTIGRVLELLLGMADREIPVRGGTARAQPPDVPAQVGDYRKFYQLTGWQPRIPLEQSLRDLLEYWRQRAKSHGAAPP